MTPRDLVDRLRLQLALLVVQPHGRRLRGERGDVPGWVMVTVMSAGIVALLTPLVGSELTSMLRNALSSVR